jgi:hypothetical protein
VTNEWEEEHVDEEAEDDTEEFGPGSADYDLSEEHGYTWEPARIEVIPRWLLVSLSIVLVAALVIPSLYIVWRFS